MRMFGFTIAAAQRHLRCLAELRQHRRDAGARRHRLDGRRHLQRHRQKIVALRDAVMALYDELAPIQTQLAANGLQAALRRRALFEHGQCRQPDPRGEPDLSADSVDYQTRVAAVTTSDADTISAIPRHAAQTPVDPDLRRARSRSPTATNMAATSASRGFSPSADHRRRPGAGADLDARLLEQRMRPGVRLGLDGRADTSGTNRSCRRRYVADRHDLRPTAITTTNDWIYEPESVDVSHYKMGNSGHDRRPATRRRTTAMTARRRRPATYDRARARRGRRPAIGTQTVDLERLHRGARDDQHDHAPRSGYTIPAQRLRPRHQPASRPTTRHALAADVPGRSSIAAPPARPGRAAAPRWPARPARPRRGGCTAWTRADMLTYVNALTPDRQHLSRHRHDLGRADDLERRHLRRQPGHLRRHARARATSSS